MSGPRDARLPPHLVALKLATRRAVEAAGGQELVAREAGRSQSRISDYCSVNTHDFIPIDLAVLVDALGGQSILADAIARQAEAPARAADDMATHLARVAKESAELIHAMAARVTGLRSARAAGLAAMPQTALRDIMAEADDLASAITALIADLCPAPEFPKAGGRHD